MKTATILKTPEMDAGELAREAEAIVAAHPYFTGRTQCLRFTVTDGKLLVCGTLPSYYLKQLLQSALKKFSMSCPVEFHISVFS